MTTVRVSPVFAGRVSPLLPATISPPSSSTPLVSECSALFIRAHVSTWSDAAAYWSALGTAVCYNGWCSQTIKTLSRTVAWVFAVSQALSIHNISPGWFARMWTRRDEHLVLTCAWSLSAGPTSSLRADGLLTIEPGLSGLCRLVSCTHHHFLPVHRSDTYIMSTKWKFFLLLEQGVRFAWILSRLFFVFGFFAWMCIQISQIFLKCRLSTRPFIQDGV